MSVLMSDDLSPPGPSKESFPMRGVSSMPPMQHVWKLNAMASLGAPMTSPRSTSTARRPVMRTMLASNAVCQKRLHISPQSSATASGCTWRAVAARGREMEEVTGRGQGSSTRVEGDYECEGRRAGCWVLHG